MPEATTITIAGDLFTIPQPYSEGHVLSANEASALNQTFAENIRNNMATKAKALKETGAYDKEVFAGTVADYADEYEFGVRTGGGRTGDPIMAEAMDITRELVRKALQRQGKSLKDYSAKQISDAARAQLAKSDDPNTQKIMATARARVEATQGIGVELDSLPADEAPVAAGKKAKAEAA